MKPTHLFVSFCALLTFVATTTATSQTNSEAEALAATFTVTNTADSGAGSFRQAVLDATAGSTITFNVTLPAVISLTSGQIVIDKSLTVQGPGATQLTVRNGNGSNRVFQVSTGIVSISGLTIKDGNLPQGGGGGISNAGTLTLTNVTVTNCQAPGSVGGGIDTTFGGLTVNGCTFSNNVAYYGGGVYGKGTITNTTITGNLASVGGGIYAISTLNVTNSTISNNTSRDAGAQTLGGGGLYSTNNATTRLTNTTVSNNLADKPVNTATAGNNGGGILIDTGTLTLTNCTVANNTVTRSASNCTTSCNSTKGFGGGISGPVTLANCIVAGNTANGGNSDVRGTVTSQGHNIIGSNYETTISGDLAGNLVGTNANPVNPQLAALAANGGPTMTRALLANSPAINAASDTNAPSTDQRGYGRNGTADIGAYEYNGTPAAVPVVSAVSRKLHGSALYDVNLPFTGSVGVECRTGGQSNAHTIIVTFVNTLASVGGAAVTSGTGTITSAQVGSDPHLYAVTLSGVSNAQRLTVTLNNVNDSTGNVSASIPVTLGLLLGDTNGDGFANSADLLQTRSFSGQPTSATNFRSDLNLDTNVNSGDATIVRTHSGESLP